MVVTDIELTAFVVIVTSAIRFKKQVHENAYAVEK